MTAAPALHSLTRPFPGNGGKTAKIRCVPCPIRRHCSWHSRHQPQLPQCGPGKARKLPITGMRTPGLRNGRTCHMSPDRSGGLACASSGPHAYSASFLQIRRGGSHTLSAYSPTPFCLGLIRQGQLVECAHACRTGAGFTDSQRHVKPERGRGARDRGGEGIMADGSLCLLFSPSVKTPFSMGHLMPLAPAPVGQQIHPRDRGPACHRVASRTVRAGGHRGRV